MTTAVSEIFPNGCSCKWSKILHGCRICRSGTHHDSIIHRTLLLQCLDQRCNSRSFLTNSNINTIHRIPCFISRALVDNRIYSNGSLSRLTVSDNQLTLSTANRNHGINCFDTGLQRLGHRLAENHPRSFPFQRHFTSFPGNFTLSIQRIAQRVNHAPDHVLIHIDRSDTPRASDRITFLNLIGRT